MVCYLLFAVCLWQYAVLLPCNGFVTDKKEGARWSQRPRKHCLQICFPVVKPTSSVKLMLSRRSCYEECLRWKGRLGFLGKGLTKQSLRRIKRDVSGNSMCCGEDGLDGKCNETAVFHPTGLKATFHKFKNTGGCYAKVSRDPLRNISVDWKGYHLVYTFDHGQENFTVKCPRVGKNETHYIVDNFGKGLMGGWQMNIAVTSYPFVSASKLEHSKAYRVPKNCSGLEATTDSSAPSRTSDFSTPPPASDYFTSSPTSEFSTPPTSDYYSPLTSVNKDSTVVTAVIVASCMFAVAALSLVFWYYRRPRKNMSHRFQMKKAEEEEKFVAKYHHKPLHFEYDAFIIYSSKDQDWVKTTLLPTLEQKHGLKCCIHYRNFAPGVLYRENMVDSVYKSRKTVAVVSQNFFGSSFCESEFEYALRRLTEWRDDSLIVIKLDDVDEDKFPMELKQRSYIDCPKSVEKETWEKKLVNCLKVCN